MILKFFYDRPKDQRADGQLADAIAKLPVLLQARIDDTEANPNSLPQRFFPEIGSSIASTKGLAGKSGWIPLPVFADKARDVGFVDSRDASFLPMLEQYQGRPVKSLALCALELALGETASLEAGPRLRLGKRSLQLNGNLEIAIQFPKSAEMAYVPFHELLESTKRDSELIGKFVIMGYDGAKIHKLETPIGRINAHRYWVLALESAHHSLTQNP